MKTFRRLALLALLLLAATTLQAATLVFDYTVSFGDDPVGVYPTATAVFEDTAVNEVTLTFTVADIGDADITEIYFNLDPILDLSLVNISYVTTDTTVLGIDIGEDLYKADGDGFFDIFINISTPDPLSSLGEIVFTITSTELLTVDSFDFWSVNAPSSYLSAIKVQSTDSDLFGPGEGSDWVGAVPVPAAVWLFGSALLGLVGVARRKNA